MSRIIPRSVAALAFVIALSPSAPAAEPAAPGTTIRAKSILGANVHLRGGTSAGTVEDIILSDEGVVDYLVVSSGGKLVTVPWDAAKFDHGKRLANIDLTQAQYQKIPTYTTDSYPTFYSPAYRTQVYKSYGLVPDRTRRLERRLERRERP